MQPRSTFACATVLVVGMAGFITHAAPRVPRAAAGPTLDLVPVNVHVIDRAGKPVTDLKASDFTLIENGAPQEIRHFSVQSLTPDPSQAPPSLTPRKGIGLSPQTNRIFLIARSASAGWRNRRAA